MINDSIVALEQKARSLYHQWLVLSKRLGKQTPETKELYDRYLAVSYDIDIMEDIMG